jgi:hypothetical protein
MINNNIITTNDDVNVKSNDQLITLLSNVEESCPERGNRTVNCCCHYEGYKIYSYGNYIFYFYMKGDGSDIYSPPDDDIPEFLNEKYQSL